MTPGGLRLVAARPELLGLGVALAVLAWALERRAGAGRRAATLRAALVLGVAAALAGPALERGGGAEPTVVLVDASASVAPGAQGAATRALGLAGSDAAQIVFGDEGGSPLAEALDEATRALPAGGRIVVLSDGRATGADPIAAAARAAAAGVRVDAGVLASREGPDAALAAVDVPLAGRAGEEVPVRLTVRATEPMSATVELRAEGIVVASERLSLSPGATSLALGFLPDGVGDVRFAARVEAAGDVEPGNDAAYGVTHVAPPPRVLVSGDGPGAVALADRLARLGLGVQVLAPERLPGRLSALEAWDALVLADVPAAALGVDQRAAVAAFVSDLGRGAVLTGGRQSFLAGGWQHTPLADLAPVRLEPPPRDEREAVAIVLMIDQSASMGSGEGDSGLTKLDLAREAAILATEVLHPGDRLGVVSYDDAARWLVEPSTVGAGRELADVEEAIATLQTGGGTRILRGLDLGLAALAAESPPTRHGVLLTDGRDFYPDREPMEAAVRQARQAGVTLSTIAVGADADRDLLARLASLGRGRYHLAADPADLPGLAVQESEIVRSRSEQTGEFLAAEAGPAPHAVLAGVDVGRLPVLRGYLATTPREGAEVALEAPGGDPLLAAWNYGLGRVLAWTSDTGEAWTTEWEGDPAADAFWARVVRYAARAPEAGPPGVTVAVAGGRANVEVDALDGNGRMVDLARAEVVVTGTEGAAVVALPQVAPGRYAGSVAVDGPGAYPAMVRLVADERAWTVPTGWAWAYSPELEPEVEDGGGEALLGAVAEAGGGEVLAGAGLALPPAVEARVALWPWLLGLAALLWPLDVARQMGLGRRRVRPPRREEGLAEGVEPGGRAA